MIIPVLLYLISLSLLYSTSMQGFYLVGSDIHSEYYIASRMYDGWDISYPHLYNASISTTLIAPWISKFLMIDLVVVFKMIYPAIFALVPVILYFVYRKVIGQWKAIFAILFFISMPVFFMEMPQLPRQQIAEVFLCIVILLLISDLEYKIFLIVPCVAIIPMLHYSIGFATIAFLLTMLVVKLINSKLKWQLIGSSKISYTGLIVSLTVAIVITAVWGLNVADGMSLRAISNIFYVGHVSTVSDSVTTQIPMATATIKSDGIISAAMGFDIFNGTSTWGKVFRVIQWITQILVILGCFRLLFRYREYKFSSEFIAGIGASAMLLVLCLTIFGFSGLLGISRFYHLSLIFLAPMFAIGLDFKINNIRRLNKDDNKREEKYKDGIFNV
jgi:uncharacterized membrane protein